MGPDKQKTILVVEDEGIVARDLQQTLIGLGYRVPSSAATARQALQLAAEQRPDLALMDIQLRGEPDGIEAATALREQYGVPVIFLTANSDAATLERAKTAAPYGFLVKPVKADELGRVLEIALSKHALDAQLLAHSEELERRVFERTAALGLANQTLEQANAELRRFAQVAAHDLQTPMRAIASFAELLGSRYAQQLDETGRDWLRRIGQAALRQQSLLRGMVQYQSLDDGLDQQAGAFDAVAMRELFDQACARLAPAARLAGAELACGELPVVWGQRSKLALLLFHLLDNAIKHRGATAPRVFFSASRADAEGQAWRFEVRDNGPGIQAWQQASIFELFRSAGDKNPSQGSGIGLALCRRVVQLHGGRIWVESEPGRGSAFQFTLAAPALQ